MSNPQEPASNRLAAQARALGGVAVPGAAVIAACAEWIATRRGLVRLVIAALAGTLAAFAMAPYHYVPLLVISFTVLTWQLDGLARIKHPALKAGLTAFAFGCGFFAAGLYWVGNAFLVDAATFGSLMGAAIAALAIALALFPAVTFALAMLLWRKDASRIIVLALAWSASEWLRGHLFSGFPWNLIGYTWGDSLAMLQVTALIGSYGLSLLTIFAAAAPAALVTFETGRASAAPLRALAGPGVAVVLFALIGGFGLWRLAQPDPPDVAGVKLRLVQPSVPQRDKITSGNAARIFGEHIALMRAPGAETITHFIWPEAAVPILLAEDRSALDAIATVLGPNQWLLAGAVRAERGTPDGADRYFNSLQVVSTDGEIVAVYDKHHLVPFGEYLPLQPLLSFMGLRQLVESESGFESGTKIETLALPGAPDVGPLICYEAIFPGRVAEPGNRPAWFLNVTDDTWFGLQAGPRQHFESARIRTIEEGLPLIRAANAGISAVVDAKGRVRQSLALNRIGVIDATLPAARPPTLYARFGDFCTLAIGLLMMVFAIIKRSSRAGT